MDDTISEAFFRWVDDNESDLDYIIMFESCENQALKFQLDSHDVIINFKTHSATSKSKERLIKKWLEYIQSLLDSPISDYYDFISQSFTHYTELKEFSSEESSSDENYHEQIKEAILVERMQNSHVTGEKVQISGLSFYKNHFIYKEAEESIQLLSETMRRCPNLQYSMNIKSNQAFCNIRVEIDLAFLQIPDSVMIMLGLNYESPLVISCSINDIRLSQTLNEQSWTPSMLGFLEFEVLQAGFCESYGCKTYIKGRVQKFRENMYNILTDSQKMGSLAVLSRENSEDVQAENPGLIGKLFGKGFSKKKVKEVLKKTKNDEAKALEMLQNDYYNADSGELSNFVIPCNNFFYNLLFYMRDRIQNCTNYCYICYKRHIADSVRLRPCSTDICEFRFEEISGISIYAEIANNPDLVALDVSFAAEAALSGRNQVVFEPFPSFLLKKDQIRGKSGFLSGNYSSDMDQNKDIPKLRELTAHIPDILMLKTLCSDEISCRDYICSQSSYGLEVYKLIRHIIATNRLNFVQLKSEDKIKALDGGIDQYIVTNHAPETLKSFSDKKAKHKSIFAFHGSAIENWYSILRNGIRNLSNTHMMTAGAAYGAGVYSAENFSTSLGYCRFGTNQTCGWPFSTLNNKACMAIIEVINRNKINRGNGIYVIENDKDIIIRYLLVLTSNAVNKNVNINDLNLSTHYEKVHEKYLKETKNLQKARIEKAIKKAKEHEQNSAKPIVEEIKLSSEQENKLKTLEQNFSGQGSTMSNKRILQEYKYLIVSKECKGLTAEFEEQNIYTWIIKIDINKFEVGKDLKKDFENYAKTYKRNMEIVFEMRFDSNYPYNPPFLRVIRPRFAFHTGHVTVGGSICMQSITRSGWIPVRTVESIFIEILFNMAEGGARLDINGSAVDYGFNEAQEAFRRVAQQHGWL